MPYRWVNGLLFVLILAELVTGAAGLAVGSEGKAFVLKAHLAGAFAIVALLGWKTALALRSLRRRAAARPRRAALLLSAILLATLGLGFAWSLGGYWRFAGLTGLSWHDYAGVGLVPLLIWHGWKYSAGLRVGYEADRRTFLRLLGASAAGAALWWGAESTVQALRLPGRDRRFTGSHERGSFSANAFPSTSWLDDVTPDTSVDAWTIELSGSVTAPARLSVAAFQALGLPSATVEATLDCTGGWYTTQRWTGVRLADLLAAAGAPPGAKSVTVVSATGYARRFPIDDARSMVLAASVGGEALTAGHGPPLRLVAPGRRGYDWVKWVNEVRVETSPAWLQTPLPVS